MNKQFIAILIVIFVAFGGLLYSQKKSDTAPEVSAEPSSYIYGVDPTEAENPDTVVNLTEYGDFQCPACGSYFPVVKEIKEKYEDRITFQFRHFPLTAIHPNAMAAHRASIAAGNQGKFWEMHDTLYERQSVWSSTSNPGEEFRGYAEELGLDLEKYDVDVASQQTNAIIQADLKAGQDLNIQGTPGFVLDGQLIESPKSIEEFDQLIQDAIARKTTG